MKYLTIAFAISMSLTIVSSQFFGPFDTFGGINSFDLRAYSGDFGGPSAFAANSLSGRDPRQNRGPVTFPPSPPDAPVESSGVIVGASGYGFVPPNQQRSIFHPGSFPSINRFNNRYFHRFTYY